MKGITTAFAIKILLAVLLLPTLAIETQAAAKGQVEALTAALAAAEAAREREVEALTAALAAAETAREAEVVTVHGFLH